jgi:hypothetical protein
MTVLLASLLAYFQRKLIYVPTRGPVTVAMAGELAERISEVSIATDDGLTLQGWFVTARPTADQAAVPARRLTIYFPGNAAHRGRRGKQIAMLNDLGRDVLIVDYRGYAENPGSPSEAALCRDARCVWNHAVQSLHYPPEQIVLFGESLGGGVATALAHALAREGTVPGGLILRATFTSLVDAAAYHYPILPVNWLLIDRFPSVQRLPEVICPLLIVHGDQDEIIPFEHAKQLFVAAPEQSANGIPKTMTPLKGAGHNDILYVAADQMEAALRTFLDRLP